MYIQFGLLYPDLTLLAPTLLQFSMPGAIYSSRCTVFIPLHTMLLQHYAANSFRSGILFCSICHIDTCTCIALM